MFAATTKESVCSTEEHSGMLVYESFDLMICDEFQRRVPVRIIGRCLTSCAPSIKAPSTVKGARTQRRLDTLSPLRNCHMTNISFGAYFSIRVYKMSVIRWWRISGMTALVGTVAC